MKRAKSRGMSSKNTVVARFGDGIQDQDRLRTHWSDVVTHASNRYVVMVATAKVMSDLGPARIAALKPGELELMIAKHLPELTLAEIRDGLAAIEKVDAAAGKP